MLMIVGVNRGLADGILEWRSVTLYIHAVLTMHNMFRYMSQRATIIVLDVLILSFGWTAITMVFFLIRGWFPFKTMVSENAETFVINTC